MKTYSKTTDGILISASPIFLEGRSNIMLKKFVFAYYIRIENQGSEPVQLMRRHWYIHNSDGEVEEVEGEGVIGEQPVIKPGEAHQYNSFCVLETFEGYMEGTYLMKRENGEFFETEIPRFNLRAAAN
jgi:ApaG protein